MKLRTFVDLTVPHYVILVASTTFSATLIVHPLISAAIAWNLALAVLSFSFAVFGLNSLNQVYDIDIDRLSKPLRPLPSGRISARGATALSLLFFLIAAAVSHFVSPAFASLIAFFVLLSVLYSVPPVRLKRYGISSNIVGGTLYGAIPFVSAWALAGGAFPLAFFIFFYGITICIATLKDFEDAATEKRFGIRTLPVLLGYEKARRFVVLGIFCLLAFMLAASLLTIPRVFVYPTLLCFLLLAPLMRLTLRRRGVVTQSSGVTTGMMLVMLMELLYGATSFIAGAAP